MFYLQLVYLTGLNTALLVHASSECLIPPWLLLNASFQEVVAGAYLEGDIQRGAG